MNYCVLYVCYLCSIKRKSIMFFFGNALSVAKNILFLTHLLIIVLRKLGVHLNRKYISLVLDEIEVISADVKQIFLNSDDSERIIL